MTEPAPRIPIGVLAAVTLIAAFVLSIGIAWFIAVRAQVNPESAGLRIRDGDPRSAIRRNALREWWDDAPPGFAQPAEFHYVIRRSNWLMQVVGAPSSDSTPGEPKVDLLMTMEAGWPRRCLSGAIWREDVAGTGTPESWRGVRLLPMRPIMTGLAWNVGLFWSILSAVFIFPRLMRDLGDWVRGQRIKRIGHCPSCGYDLQRLISDGCPECGWNRE